MLIWHSLFILFIDTFVYFFLCRSSSFPSCPVTKQISIIQVSGDPSFLSRDGKPSFCTIVGYSSGEQHLGKPHVDAHESSQQPQAGLHGQPESHVSGQGGPELLGGSWSNQWWSSSDHCQRVSFRFGQHSCPWSIGWWTVAQYITNGKKMNDALLLIQPDIYFCFPKH